jgi:hypothetical protein
MGDFLEQEMNDKCGKTIHMRTMDRGFTVNANNKNRLEMFQNLWRTDSDTYQ